MKNRDLNGKTDTFTIENSLISKDALIIELNKLVEKCPELLNINHSNNDAGKCFHPYVKLVDNSL